MEKFNDVAQPLQECILQNTNEASLNPIPLGVTKIIKDDFPLIQPYMVLTDGVVKDLLKVAQILPQQSKEGADGLLSIMKKSVQTLEELANRVAKYAEIKGNDYEKHLEEIENEIANIQKEKNGLEENIRNIEATIAKLETERGLTDKLINELIREINDNRGKIEDLQRRAEELKQWWWVPGYGQYLAIRTLVDDDINRYNRSLSSLSRLQNEIENNRISLARINDALIQQRILCDSQQKRITELNTVRDECQEERIRAKKGVVFSMEIEVFYKTLGQKLNTIGRRVEDVKHIAEYLNSKTAVSSLAGNEVLVLKDALIKFGQYADTLPFVEIIPLTRAPKFESDVEATEIESSVDQKSNKGSPVIRWQGIHFWPLNYKDDREKIAIVAYNGAGEKIRRWSYQGGRDITDIKINLIDNRVTLFCNANKQIHVPWKELTRL